MKPNAISGDPTRAAVNIPDKSKDMVLHEELNGAHNITPISNPIGPRGMDLSVLFDGRLWGILDPKPQT